MYLENRLTCNLIAITNLVVGIYNSLFSFFFSNKNQKTQTRVCTYLSIIFNVYVCEFACMHVYIMYVMSMLLDFWRMCLWWNPTGKFWIHQMKWFTILPNQLSQNSSRSITDPFWLNPPIELAQSAWTSTKTNSFGDKVLFLIIGKKRLQRRWQSIAWFRNKRKGLPLVILENVYLFRYELRQYKEDVQGSSNLCHKWTY